MKNVLHLSSTCHCLFVPYCTCSTCTAGGSVSFSNITWYHIPASWCFAGALNQRTHITQKIRSFHLLLLLLAYYYDNQMLHVFEQCGRKPELLEETHGGDSNNQKASLVSGCCVLSSLSWWNSYWRCHMNPHLPAVRSVFPFFFSNHVLIHYV